MRSTVKYISGKREVLFAALAGYENERIALNTGMIMREMLRREGLCKILLYSEQFYKFPHYIETTTFGISTDVYTSLKDTLWRHRPMVAEYLEKNYDRVSPTSCFSFFEAPAHACRIVLQLVYNSYPFQQLCHETPIAQATRRNSP